MGTASWSDPGFVEHWYPKKMPAGDRLPWYAQHFEMVEVNSTFYAVPDARLMLSRAGSSLVRGSATRNFAGQNLSLLGSTTAPGAAFPRSVRRSAPARRRPPDASGDDRLHVAHLDRRRHTVTDGGIVVVTAEEEPLISPISEDSLRAEAEADRTGPAQA